MKNSVFITLIATLLTSCNLLVPEGPQIPKPAFQLSENKVQHKRLHFTLTYRHANYHGFENVNSYQKVLDSQIDNLKSNESVLRLDFEMTDGSIESEYQIVEVDQSEHIDHKHVSYKYEFQTFVDVNADIDFTKVNGLNIYQGDELVSILPGSNITKPFNRHEVDSDWNKKSLVQKVIDNGPSENRLDFVFIAEGYDNSEINLESWDKTKQTKFGKDVEKSITALLGVEPYASQLDKINVWIVGTESLHSGADVPTEGVFKNTVLDATYDGYCARRSLLVRNQRRALELASLTPFDQMIVLVNDKIHGGQGGYISTFSVDGPVFDTVIVHEIAHSFAGLSDHYWYFTDQNRTDTCKDTRYKEYVINNERHNLANSDGDLNEDLSHDLTLDPLEQSPKWQVSGSIEEHTVYFDYPTEKPTINADENTVQFKFKTEKSKDTLIFLAEVYDKGPEGRLMPLNASDFKVIIKEESLDASDLTVERLSSGTALYRVYFDTDVPTETDITVHLNYDEQYKNSMAFSVSSRIGFSLPSKDFDLNMQGYFQGAIQSVSKVFRPTYASTMRISERGHSPREIEVIEAKISTYVPSDGALP
jgi:hypothetical protein